MRTAGGVIASVFYYGHNAKLHELIVKAILSYASSSFSRDLNNKIVQFSEKSVWSVRSRSGLHIEMVRLRKVIFAKDELMRKICICNLRLKELCENYYFGTVEPGQQQQRGITSFESCKKGLRGVKYIFRHAYIFLWRFLLLFQLGRRAMGVSLGEKKKTPNAWRHIKTEPEDGSFCSRGVCHFRK